MANNFQEKLRTDWPIYFNIQILGLDAKERKKKRSGAQPEILK